MSAPLHSLEVGDTRLTWIPDGIRHVRALERYPSITPASWNVHSGFTTTTAGSS